ncbi:hypothetical protein KM043_004437 [Ampulex compressa]|nr:hypothetical protein KM043_004437 [Ampulex compressa]
MAALYSRSGAVCEKSGGPNTSLPLNERRSTTESTSRRLSPKQTGNRGRVNRTPEIEGSILADKTVPTGKRIPAMMALELNALYNVMPYSHSSPYTPLNTVHN